MSIEPIRQPLLPPESAFVEVSELLPELGDAFDRFNSASMAAAQNGYYPADSYQGNEDTSDLICECLRVRLVRLPGRLSST